MAKKITTKDRIVEVAKKIDDLPFPPTTKDEIEVWENLLLDLNILLCTLYNG